MRGWNPVLAVFTLACFLLVDGSFIIAGLPKFLDGGYVPFAISAALTTIALTWLEGRRCIAISLHDQMEPVEQYLTETRGLALPAANGTMVFLTGDPNGVPFMLKHRWLKRRAYHERIVLLNLSRVQGPYARSEQSRDDRELSDRLVRVDRALRLHGTAAHQERFSKRAARTACTSKTRRRRSFTPIRNSCRPRTACRAVCAGSSACSRAIRARYRTTCRSRPTAAWRSASKSGFRLSLDKLGMTFKLRLFPAFSGSGGRSWPGSAV